MVDFGAKSQEFSSLPVVERIVNAAGQRTKLPFETGSETWSPKRLPHPPM